MKFHCDRCKTRYSIADERVRGKILKIRCKNCSAVITVKEGMKAPALPEPARGAPRRRRPASRAGSARSIAQPQAPSPLQPGGPAAGGATGGRAGSALEGAFQEAIESAHLQPGAADSLSNAPAALEAEWYVALEGEQSGPFTLTEAQAWVSRQAAGDEVFCWSEGFDDWLLADEVPHFHGLRLDPALDAPTEDDGLQGEATTIGPPPTMPQPDEPQPAPAFSGGAFRQAEPRAAAPAPAADQPSWDPAPPARPGPAAPALSPEKTPQPLFAATLAAVAAESPTLMEEPSSSNGKPRASGDYLQMPPREQAEPPAADKPGGDMDLDIGEVSRVVKLPVPSPGGEAPPYGALDRGFGRGSGSHGALPGHAPPAGPGFQAPAPAMMAPRRRAGLLIPFIIAGVVLAGVVVVLVILATGSDQPDGSGDYVARTGVADEGLSHQFSNPIKQREEVKEESEEKESEANAEGGKKSSGKVASGKRRSGKASRRRGSSPSGEVDLSGSTSARNAVVQGYLDPGEVSRAAKKYRFLTQRCYERALKKDPLLDVPKTKVSITVAPSGRVSKVSIPSLSGQVLGSCLRSSVRTWKFPRSTKGLSTSFPLVFR